MFNSFLNDAKKKIAAAVLVLLSLGGGSAAVVHFGAFNPTGGGTYYLQSTISSSQTTITLSSFKEPGSNILYTMSYLNSSIEYATIAPQTTQSEFISFSGITQNADGSATLTGVVRGLGRSYPYTASSTLASPHPGQSRLILSNPPQLTNQYLNLNNSGQQITGSIAFTVAPTSTVECATPFEYCRKQYIDAGLNQGAATSTETNQGLVQLATAAQVGVGTASSSGSAPLVIENKFATTTPGTICTSGVFNCVVAASLGKISQSFLDLTAAFTVSGTWIFNGVTQIAASASFPLTLNTLAYIFPSTRAASSTVLTENGSGTLTWLLPQVRTASTTVLNASSASTATTTLATVVLPIGSINSTSTMLRITSMWSDISSAGACFLQIDYGNGTASTTIAFYTINLNFDGYPVAVTTVGFATTTNNMGFSNLISTGGGATPLSTSNAVSVGAYSSSTPTSALTYLAFRTRTTTSATCQLIGQSVEILSH